MRHLELPGADHALPIMGQGTWGLGEDAARRTKEVDVLRLGISLGMTLIDTAEVYGHGRAESVIGDAVRDLRDEVFIVAKLWPSHARRADIRSALQAMLRRMNTSYVDALLLHWPTRLVPVKEALHTFRDLRDEGMVRWVGVSNFDERWLREIDGEKIAFHEIPYCLAERRVEHSLLGAARAQGHVVLAYSPLGHGRHRRWPGWPTVRALAEKRGVTPEQIALAWVINHPGVIAIPKSAQEAHVRANAEAADLVLDGDEMMALDRAFPTSGRWRTMLPTHPAVHRLVWWGMGLVSHGPQP